MRTLTEIVTIGAGVYLGKAAWDMTLAALALRRVKRLRAQKSAKLADLAKQFEVQA